MLVAIVMVQDGIVAHVSQLLALALSKEVTRVRIVEKFIERDHIVVNVEDVEELVDDKYVIN